MQTLEGHAQNISCVGFHPELPIILTGSEDGMWQVFLILILILIFFVFWGVTHSLKGKPYFFPFFFLCKVCVHCRRGSRINTDRFPTRVLKAQAFRGVRGHVFPGAFLDFNSLKSSFLGFRVIQTGYWLVPFTLDEAPQLGKFFCLLKIYRFWKIWPISVKPRKPVWIRACTVCYHI